jgi:plastocyanin
MRARMMFVGFFLLSTLFFPVSGSAKAPEEIVEISEPAELTAWSFAPASISVSAGTTVVWKNTGRETHSVTSQDQLFDSKLLDPGKGWSYTFDTPGVYRYFCVPHPWMKGTVIVTSDDSSRRGGSASQATPTSTPTSVDRGSAVEP